MQTNTKKTTDFLDSGMMIAAWITFLGMLLVLSQGEGILQEVGAIYPDWSFAAFFIPWFLLLISSVQKLRDKHSTIRLRIWMLKTTIPIFVFISPFFSKYIATNSLLLEVAPYCLYMAIIVLFLLNFLPLFNAKQK
ncbi:hypothetical protein [Psychromonas hadalis]|uniref:hypothetical protein n=1 Tax=Psychromonas hadalis TaxID=211669 RepID=UPI0003B50B16|nr:hypothetical protein [Psychromonas hadalis]